MILAILLSVGCVFVSLHLIAIVRPAWADGNVLRLAHICLLFGMFYLMLLYAFTYLLADYGHEKRQPIQFDEGSQHGRFRDCGKRDPLLILVPSYKEDEDIIRQTLISTALVEYPRRRVVLLIDDAPTPTTAQDAAGLQRSRDIPKELQAEFDQAARPFQAAELAFRARQHSGKIRKMAEGHRLARLYEDAASWLETQAVRFTKSNSASRSHTDRLFAEKILLEPARMHRERAQEIRHMPPGARQIGEEFHRLACLFSVEFSGFERKQYQNLSHTPNKAMNLNSYISLIGKSFREVERPSGLNLEASATEHATVHVPAAAYIATVDADSLITADFALRLIPIMEARGNERIAVAQTPYTAIPEPPSPLERAAAASTDVQFFSHQGMAYFGASWWVGASALMRHAALEDIAVEREERGHKIKVYIRDEILIEDAAATIDLVSKGWWIYHDPSRLSYSATPSDFGALIIQRRRWSNGGLLIVPSLVRHVLRWPWSLGKLKEGLLRLQNLLSASISGVALRVVLLCRFDDDVVPLWMPLVALPYYFLYASDLVLAGYRWTDLPRVYVLNTLLLVPVYLAGTLQSLRQALTGEQRAFKRTPKIENRTPVPISYLTAEYGLLFYCFYCAINDAIEGRYDHMVFSSVNGIALLYGIFRFIGFQNSLDDAFATLRSGSLRSVAAALGVGAGRQPLVGFGDSYRRASAR